MVPAVIVLSLLALVLTGFRLARWRKERNERLSVEKLEKDMTTLTALAQPLCRHDLPHIRSCAVLALELLHSARKAHSCNVYWRPRYLTQFAQFLVSWAQTCISDPSCDENGVAARLLCAFIEQAKIERYDLAQEHIDQMWTLPEQTVAVRMLALKVNIWVLKRCGRHKEAQRCQRLADDLPLVSDVAGDYLKFTIEGD